VTDRGYGPGDSSGEAPGPSPYPPPYPPSYPPQPAPYPSYAPAPAGPPYAPPAYGHPVYPPAPTPPTWPAAASEARPYPQLLRGYRHRWWRTLVSIAVVLGALVGLFMASAVAFVVVALATGVDLQNVVNDQSILAQPGFVLLNNLLLAALIPIAMAGVWAGHLWRPRWVSSVAGGVRWRWLGECAVISLVLMVVSSVVLYAIEIRQHVRSGRRSFGCATRSRSRADRARATSSHADSHVKAVCTVMRSIEQFHAQDVLTAQTKSSGIVAGAFGNGALDSGIRASAPQLPGGPSGLARFRTRLGRPRRAT